MAVKGGCEAEDNGTHKAQCVCYECPMLCTEKVVPGSAVILQMSQYSMSQNTESDEIELKQQND